MSEDATLGFENSEHPPFFRATYADGRLSMVMRHRWFPDEDSWAKQFFNDPRNGTVIADLTIIHSAGRLELVVDELAQAGRPDFRMMLTEWARLLGYRRIWIGLEVIELGDDLLAWDTRVVTRCFGCHTIWRSNQEGFWIRARQTGVFPNSCALCGQILPCWVQDVTATDEEVVATRSKCP